MPRTPKPWYRKDRKAWFVTIAGKRHNLGPEKKAAFDQFHQLMIQPQKRKVAPESFAGIADAYLDWVKLNRAPATFEWYQFRLQLFTVCYPSLSMHELRPFHVERWAASYELAITSRRNLLRSVKRCVRWARKMGYITEDPLAELEVPGGEAKEIALTQDDFDELLSFSKGESFRDLLQVSWETGCRPQESLIVESRHVDVANQRWVFSKAESKMKRIGRVVYLTDTAMRIVQRLISVHPIGPDLPPGMDPLFKW